MIAVRAFAAADRAVVTRIVNEAFQADAFFKKVGFKDRLTDNGERLLRIMETPENALLVAVDTTADEIVGSIHVHWHAGDADPHGGFGMLSVAAARERAGIGKTLVRAAGLCTCPHFTHTDCLRRGPHSKGAGWGKQVLYRVPCHQSSPRAYSMVLPRASIL
jgi:hypothetical protein